MTTTTALLPIPQRLDFDALAPTFSRAVSSLDATSGTRVAPARRVGPVDDEALVSQLVVRRSTGAAAR